MSTTADDPPDASGDLDDAPHGPGSIGEIVEEIVERRHEADPEEHHHPLTHIGEHDVTPPHELSPVDRFDEAVSRMFDGMRGTEPADRIFYAITELADFSLIWLLIAAGRAATSDKQINNAVRVGTVLAIESVVVNAGIKSIFKRERPVVQVERPHKLRVPLTTSFPSGHSSAATVAAILLTEDSRFPLPYYVLAGLVASSRIYVRIHHASDVVGGVAVGLVLGTIARKAWPLDKGPIGTRRLRRRWAVRRALRPGE